ncbi:MAG: hypothetical protein WC809_10025 [Sinimarinibacterium sp.]
MSQRRATAGVAALCAAAVLNACSGDYSGVGGGIEGAGGTGAPARNLEEHFTTQVQPRLDFCRNCHVPGGIADVDAGRNYMLSADRAQDLANLRASWERLGGNGADGTQTSRILLMASGQETPHSGGAPWPVGSEAYRAMSLLLDCFADPAACSDRLAGAGGGTVDELPLLGSRRGGHAWFDYCEGKTDDAMLPVDPRALVVTGSNAGKAVIFNAWYKDCHADPALVNEQAHPQTCGDLRASLARGRVIMEGNGVPGAASFFAGQEPAGYASIPASSFNNLWIAWGLSARPDNFDELVAERYGTGPVPVRNPYPVDGEDPNATDGGSGQLPRGFFQSHNADGRWSGNVVVNCQGCHSITVGTADDGPGLGNVVGGGGALLDASVTARDLEFMGVVAYTALDRAGLGGRVRGTNNAQFSNITAATGITDPTQFGDVLNNGTTGTGDTPAWWNVGSRPVKFVDAMFPNDAVRVDYALFIPLLDQQPIPSGTAAAEEWVSANVQDGDHYIMSIKSPAYPLPVDTALAQQGAILFHSKDLWAEGLDNPVPRPAGGNGSCASCHGAYSPRFVHDPAFLDTPALEGIASYVTPMEIIGTDPVRQQSYNEGTNQANSNTFVGYPETQGTENDCGVQNREAVRGERPLGYAAPPLYGVWATAPYFHNGSVPDAWGVLKSDDRPSIWRRVSRPARADQAGQVVMGFDTDLARAYDPARLGWKYDELACGTGTLPYLECDPADPEADPILQMPFDEFYANLLAGWNITNPPILTNADVEQRKIYNTRMFSQDNGGHAFTAVLTDAERRALVEYLKTL